MTSLVEAIREQIPSIPQAKAALRAMRKELTMVRTYAEILRVIHKAEVFKVLFQHVDDVRQEAEDAIVIGKQRIGEELKKVEKATKWDQSDARVTLTKGKAATGLTRKERSRLQQLADISAAEITQISKALRAEGHDVTVNAILKWINKERGAARRATRRRAMEDAPVLDGAYEYRIGRAQDMLTDIRDKKPMLILTDPPYEDIADRLFDWMFEFSAEVLPAGGSLICFTGHHRLPRDFEFAAKYDLRYWWLLSLQHTESRRLRGKFVVACHKPVLWFVKERRRNNEYVLDVLTSQGRDKDQHDWGQGEAGVTALINALTEPGDLIVDPFAGSGLWGRIAVAQKRRWIGCDVVKGGSTKVVI